MRALKALVIGMGVLIVAGLAAVAFAIANHVGTRAPAETAAPLLIPPGAEILETDLERAAIALRLRLADGTIAIHVHDRASGRRIGAYPIAPAGGP